MDPSRWQSFFKRLTIFLGEHEKVMLAMLSVVIVISGTFWYRQYATVNGNQPAAGGTFVEGVVGGRQELEDETARLTKAGLFSFDKDGQLQKQLVQNWTVNADNTEYRFTLLPQVSLTEIRNDLVSEGNVLGAAVASTDKNQLVITLQNGDPSLPLLLAQPLFDFGPYQLSKMSSEVAILSRSTRPQAVSPYINRVIINTFANNAGLQKALKNHQIDGALVNNADVKMSGYQTKTFDLPRYYTIFFNVNRLPFRDGRFGQAVAAASSIPAQSFTLTAPTSEPYATLAKNLIAKWQAAGASVTLDSKSEGDIANQVAPSRNFQALLSGVDYGYELDPFYLWHSSQIRPPGNNLTGYKNDQNDTTISQIRSTTNIPQRLALITALNQTLQSQGVAMVVQQQSVSYVISNAIRSVNPWVPDTAPDWLQAIALWSVK